MTQLLDSYYGPMLSTHWDPYLSLWLWVVYLVGAEGIISTAEDPVFGNGYCLLSSRYISKPLTSGTRPCLMVAKQQSIIFFLPSSTHLFQN